MADLIRKKLSFLLIKTSGPLFIFLENLKPVWNFMELSASPKMFVICLEFYGISWKCLGQFFRICSGFVWNWLEILMLMFFSGNVLDLCWTFLWHVLKVLGLVPELSWTCSRFVLDRKSYFFQNKSGCFFTWFIRAPTRRIIVNKKVYP